MHLILSKMVLKGEAVFLINTHNILENNTINIEEQIKNYLQQGLSVKEIIRDNFLLKHASRNELYELAEIVKKNIL
jgi:16S rRNA C1402 (ribose-2'-O) methylase RsmI